MRGICLFVMGSLKKVILADTFGTAVDYGYSNLELMHGWDALLLAVFYSLQLYFDFSGYCDMGRGISRMFGIELPVNFQSPYQARNIIDFLETVAYHAEPVFYQIYLYPVGREPEREGKDIPESVVCFLCQRDMAWGRMEFYPLGDAAWAAVCPNEDVAG